MCLDIQKVYLILRCRVIYSPKFCIRPFRRLTRLLALLGIEAGSAEGTTRCTRPELGPHPSNRQRPMVTRTFVQSGWHKRPSLLPECTPSCVENCPFIYGRKCGTIMLAEDSWVEWTDVPIARPFCTSYT